MFNVLYKLTRRQLITLGTTFILLLGLIFAVNLALHPQDIRKKAAETIEILTAKDLITFTHERGIEGDFWADKIIGQPAFTETEEWSTVGDKAWIPSGVIVDRSDPSDNKLYVWDAGNNRILGFHLNKCLTKDPQTRCYADLVIGQPTFNTSSCNGDSAFQKHPTRAPSSATTLCGVEESEKSPGEGGSTVSFSVNKNGDLFVPDYHNNRVLKFNNPFNTDVVADEVWGQDDFAGNLPNKGQSSPDDSSLKFYPNYDLGPAGVEIDDDNYLWVADKHNNRVLRFPPNFKRADLVLGQDSFTTNSAGSSLNQLERPGAIRVKGTGENKKVFVTDNTNNRIVVYSYPFSNGMQGTIFGSGFKRPSGIEIDPQGQGIWINDTRDAGKELIELWDEAGTRVIKVIGASKYVPFIGNSSDYDKFYNSYFQENFGSLGISSSGDICTAPRQGYGLTDNTVLCYKGPFTTFGTDRQADVLFFSPPRKSNLISRSEIGSVKGIVIAKNQLIVADYGRILYWNNPPSFQNGQPADGVINYDQNGNFKVTNTDSDFLQRNYLWATSLSSDNNNLYILYNNQTTHIPEILVFSLPLSANETVSKKIIFPIPFLGSGTFTPDGNFEVAGIAATPDGNFLWLTHSDASRVIRIRNPLTNPVADIVIGQDNLQTISCNKGLYPCDNHWCSPPEGDPSRTESSLCLPGALALDKYGNLFISDNSIESRGNKRLMIFKADLFPQNNTKTIFGIKASKIIEKIETNKPAFDSKNQMVVGFSPFRFRSDAGLTTCPATPYISSCNFLAYYLNPFASDTSSPDGYLKDYYTHPYILAFDENDNLYAGDMNRPRVLVYFKPLNKIPSQTPTPTPTPTLSPTFSETTGTLERGLYSDWCSSWYFGCNQSLPTLTNNFTISTIKTELHWYTNNTVTLDLHDGTKYLNPRVKANLTGDKKGWVTFNFNPPLSLCAGKTYKFFLTKSNSGNVTWLTTPGDATTTKHNYQAWLTPGGTCASIPTPTSKLSPTLTPTLTPPPSTSPDLSEIRGDTWINLGTTYSNSCNLAYRTVLNLTGRKIKRIDVNLLWSWGGESVTLFLKKEGSTIPAVEKTIDLPKTSGTSWVTFDFSSMPVNVETALYSLYLKKTGTVMVQWKSKYLGPGVCDYVRNYQIWLIP